MNIEERIRYRIERRLEDIDIEEKIDDIIDECLDDYDIEEIVDNQLEQLYRDDIINSIGNGIDAMVDGYIDAQI